MTLHGTIRNGAVELDEPSKLPDGTKVEITPAATEQTETLYDVLKDFVGMADELPPDMSLNHDHYLHGAPKK